MFITTNNSNEPSLTESMALREYISSLILSGKLHEAAQELLAVPELAKIRGIKPLLSDTQITEFHAAIVHAELTA